MSNAQYGDTVMVHYTGQLENGDVFADSKDEDPIEVTIGDGQFIPGFEKGVVGMAVGETKTITLTPEEAFGTRHQELVLKVGRSQLPENLVPAIGQELKIRYENGKTLEVRVTDIDEETVSLDANHPLAGHTLTFNIQLIAVK